MGKIFFVVIMICVLTSAGCMGIGEKKRGVMELPNSGTGHIIMLDGK